MNGRSDTFEQYLSRALAGEARQGTRLAVGLVDGGVPIQEVVTGLLAETQRQVGERWHLNRCSVADEHLATAVTVSALEAISDHLEPRDVVGCVAVACAEGDWHSLPARMFCELLRARGWDVWFLGASTPADDLGMMLARRRPDALVVSCAVANSFLGVHRLVGAAHSRGIPVLAGGRAFGGDGTRAARLGADGWAGDVEVASELLSRWVDAPPVRMAAAPARQAAVTLARTAQRQADLALRSLVDGGVVDETDERSTTRLRHELALTTEFLAAALLVDDDTIFTDFALWMDAHHGARNIPGTLLFDYLAALRPHVGAIDARGSVLLQVAATAVGAERLARLPFVMI